MNLQSPFIPRTPADRRGFSFTEVLFAVMILGIGFIMVAAIFPVAIQQAKTTTEETTAAAVARGGANVLEKIATNQSMPATGNTVVGANFDGDGTGSSVNSDGQTLGRVMQGSAIPGADPRYAWVPFYRRAGNPADPQSWSPFAQVLMVPVQARNESQFMGAPRVYDNGKGEPDIHVGITNGLNGAPDTVFFKDAKTRGIPSEGAFLIIGNATKGKPNWDDFVAPHLHGRIYRLGNPVPMADPAALPTHWELMPGFDFDPIRVDADQNAFTGGQQPSPFDGKETIVKADNDLDDVRVFVVGRAISPSDPGTPANPNREGTAMDVAAYTTFVNVK